MEIPLEGVLLNCAKDKANEINICVQTIPWILHNDGNSALLLCRLKLCATRSEEFFLFGKELFFCHPRLLEFGDFLLAILWGSEYKTNR